MAENYKGNPNVKGIGVKQNYTPKQLEEYVKCATDPVYFIKNYIKIVSLDEGFIPFDLYPYQERLINTFHNNRFVIAKIGRQSGKSVTCVSYLLWCVLFNSDYSVAILANKGATARQILQRAIRAYEALPKWLQQGAALWNKGSMELENGSRIVASATSANSIRGDTFNCIGGDSLITVMIGEKIKKITINELYELANSSKETNSYKYLYENSYETVRETIFFSNREIKINEFKKRNRNRKTSYTSKVYGRNKYKGKFSIYENRRPFGSTSLINFIYKGNAESKNDSCLSYDDSWTSGKCIECIRDGKRIIEKKIFRFEAYNANRENSYRRNKEKNISCQQRENNKRGNEKENFEIENGCKDFVYRGTQKKYIHRAEGEEKNKGAYGENKQEPRKNIENSNETSWYETKRRIEIENVECSKRKNSLEQRPEDEIKVLTNEGWKNFYGIIKTHNQPVIQLKYSGLICTSDHKILHNGVWKNAKELPHVDLEARQDVFDLLHVEDVNSFIANDITVHNCVFLDEFAFVPDNIADDFMMGVYPTISSGKTSKIFIVSTPNGMNHYYKEWVKADEGQSEYVPFEVHWSEVPGRDAKWKEQQIRNTSEEKFAQEFNTEFIGSANTLISSTYLNQLAFKSPIFSKNSLDIYENPEKQKSYFISVDVGKGRGLDYSVYNVIDVTDYPYKQVAKYRNNDISHLVFPSEIEKIARAYNNATVLVELNEVGGEVANILYQDLEYENIFFVKSGNRYDLGITQNKQTKRIGCSNFKDLIETNKLIVQDLDTITEMSTFIKKRKMNGAFSYEADAGQHDDLVMSLVNFAWAVQQPQFKDLLDHNLREKMLEERSLAIQDQSLGFLFYSTGKEEEQNIPFGEADLEKKLNDWLIGRT